MVDCRFTDAVLEAALERGRTADRAEPRALSARYDTADRRMVVELTNGCALAFPTDDVQGLRGADASGLVDVAVVAGGRALRWEALDVDLGVAGLVQGILGTAAWMRSLRGEMGRVGGRASTPAKASAARENGRKGGRPRKPSAGTEPRRET
jgi:hypothetical protein